MIKAKTISKLISEAVVGGGGGAVRDRVVMWDRGSPVQHTEVENIKGY